MSPSEKLATETKRPSIAGKLPGPKAQAAMARDKRYISPSYTRSYPLVAKSGKGMWVEDVDGNVFLDFAAGIAVNSTGHCHPRVVAAVQKQAAELIHMAGTDFYYEAQSRLAEMLSEIAPGEGTKRTFFSNSGTEAVECAMKLARYRTGRYGFLAFQGSFHGRTMGSVSLTCSKSVHKAKMGPFLSGVTHVPYPNPFRNETGMPDDEFGEHCVDRIEKEYFKRYAPPEDIAAVFVEPIQGEGGYVVPPKTFLPRLRELCDRHKILLVLDEVQAGMGRTGKYFAVEHFGVVPDIICSAKGIATGLPLGATIASEELMEWVPGAHANTYGGNPLACVAAMEVIRLLKEELLENAREQGAYLKRGLEQIMKHSRVIGDVRGLGLMIGAEIVTDRETNEPDAKLRDAIVDKAFYKGLLLLGCGPNTIRFCPSLIVSRAEIDVMLEILEATLKDVA